MGAGGVYDLGYRIVWCPKYRRPVFAGSVRDRCEELVRRKCTEHEWMVVAWEVTPDHVRLFVKAHPKHFPSCVANPLKGLTSRVLRVEFGHLRSRLPALWSRSYFAGAVGAVSPETVRRYVDTRYGRLWRVERAR
ncbi:transposase IS200-family protein [Parafrankia sp. EAN1pec]|nr:transposase IS200-family protein [Frankia sp. EAN1pec]